MRIIVVHLLRNIHGALISIHNTVLIELKDNKWNYNDRYHSFNKRRKRKELR